MHYKFKVVDGDQNADVYGEATNPNEAMTIAASCFVDAVDRVELYGPIHLSNGETLERAFVVFTK
jgi:hypothetical protein